MWFLESRSTNPYYNLALEEHLFRKLGRGESLFMLWQNNRTIVVGQYQNTIQEINMRFVRENGIKVVRRMSGGGAVYHDLGNLNFTFITDAKTGEQQGFSYFCRPILEALGKLGVNAELTGRNDMVIHGKKFSGSSQFVRGGRILHHGTLLFRSDLQLIAQALNVNADKIVSKGITSVSSRVANIADALPETMSVRDLKQHLLHSIGEMTPLETYSLTVRDRREILTLTDKKYSTWEWNYGRSPRYETTKRRRIEGCGTVEISMSVAQGGIIDGIQFFGDFFGSFDMEQLEMELIGVPCRYETLCQKLGRCNLGNYIYHATPQQVAEIIAY